MSNDKERFKIEMSPFGIAHYPRLETPDTKFNDDGEYKVKLAIPVADARPLIDKLTAMADKMFEEAKAEAAKAPKTPGKKPVEVKQASLPWFVDEEAGLAYFNFKAKASWKDKKTGATKTFAPARVDAKKKPLPMTVQISTGTEMRVAFQANPFFKPAVGAGVTLRLYAVQVVKLVEYTGSSADAFGEADGYTYDGAADDCFPAGGDPEVGDGGGNDPSEF